MAGRSLTGQTITTFMIELQLRGPEISALHLPGAIIDWAIAEEGRPFSTGRTTLRLT
jgi:hypothetical protein